jgi:hypothetical protein
VHGRRGQRPLYAVLGAGEAEVEEEGLTFSNSSGAPL